MLEILYFAQIKEKIGKSREEIAYSATVEQVLTVLKEQYPILHELKYMVAVNEEYALPTTILNDGDVLALIPPVSGG